MVGGGGVWLKVVVYTTCPCGAHTLTMLAQSSYLCRGPAWQVVSRQDHPTTVRQTSLAAITLCHNHLTHSLTIQ